MIPIYVRVQSLLRKRCHYWHPFFTCDVQILLPSLMGTSYTWYGRRFLVVTCLVGSVGKNVEAFFDLYIYIYIYVCIIFLSFYMMSHFNPALCLPFSVKKRKKLFFVLNIKLSKSPLKDWHVLKVALELGQKSLFGVKLREK